MGDAFEYAKNNDIALESSYPYEPKPGSCNLNVTKVDVGVSDYRYLPPDDEIALQRAVAQIGPISVTVDASQPSFQLYNSGIYYDSNCSKDPIMQVN